MKTQVPYGVYDGRGLRKYLNIRESKQFLEEARKLEHRRMLFCVLILFVGCRISEALNLKKGDVDAQDCIVRVRCLKKRGKTVIRRNPIPPFLVRGLLGLEVEEDGLLWKMSRVTGWRVVKSVMLNAEIAGVHACPKGLRHAFGVRSALANVPLNIIQLWLGHASPTTTAIYLAAQDEEERQLAGRTWL